MQFRSPKALAAAVIMVLAGVATRASADEQGILNLWFGCSGPQITEVVVMAAPPAVGQRFQIVAEPPCGPAQLLGTFIAQPGMNSVIVPTPECDRAFVLVRSLDEGVN